ncbi:hypothetical protein ACNS7O_11085 [Haloferacaceae archaeon DSL9]
MKESLLWGGIGILLAIVGAVLITPEVQAAMAHGDTLHLAYGIGVFVAAALTVLIIAPGLLTGE